MGGCGNNVVRVAQDKLLANTGNQADFPQKLYKHIHGPST